MIKTIIKKDWRKEVLADCARIEAAMVKFNAALENIRTLLKMPKGS
ncbi:hypothetical protein LCGC14_1823910 [marine sediment metagenome]|uniref:Uncharacterized protein n=1 Tax=marine sediment metagenome TaxID=412755 RepID=A0A0F9GI28_9ZZZZ